MCVQIRDDFVECCQREGRLIIENDVMINEMFGFKVFVFEFINEDFYDFEYPRCMISVRD